ncbi:MAG: SagB family peptide dehydrogenase [Prochloraceae cyanobacterium]
MLRSLLLSFPKNTSVFNQSEDDLVIDSPLMKLNLQQLSPGFVEVMRILGNGGATEDALSEVVLKSDGGSVLPRFYYYLQQFINCGLICYTLQAEGLPLATLVPFSNAHQLQWTQVAREQKYILSRFAYCRKDNSQLVLESPLSHAQITFADWRGGALLSELAQPHNCSTLTKISGISADAAQMFLSLLLSTKMLSEVAEDGKISEEENHNLAQWEFHDLLFHSRSRSSRHGAKIGKSYRFLGKIKPLPAIKPKMSPEVIDLYKPDLEQLKQTDASLTLVLEQRNSVRIHGQKAIAEEQLGEFLYRAARVREIIPREYMEVSDRPYPGGGACYELELYLAINTCANIPSGLYHYCPQDHQLEKISGSNKHTEALLANAQQANGAKCLPQILIIFAARFSRVSWAYESIAYSLILKHVGVLYQTMYLVATAMGLAPCALGTGNADLLAEATECDYYTESSVGEFILGSKTDFQ